MASSPNAPLGFWKDLVMVVVVVCRVVVPVSCAHAAPPAPNRAPESATTSAIIGIRPCMAVPPLKTSASLRRPDSTCGESHGSPQVPFIEPRFARAMLGLASYRGTRMKSDGIAFHHPLAFWLGCIAVAMGVCLHMPMYIMAAPMHYHLAGMAMDTPMSIGMGLIPCGVLLAAYGLMPHLAQLRQNLQGHGNNLYFH